MENKSKEQIEYDEFTVNTPASVQEQYCSDRHVFKFERLIIESLLKTKSILDVGCGTGNRLFSFYDQVKVNYMGVERANGLILGSNYPNKIVNLDLTDKNFVIDLTRELQIRNFDYDTIGLFGAVVNGFIDPISRETGWKNLAELVKKDQSLIVSTSIYPAIFDDKQTGELVRINPTLPCQYFYSKKEFYEIFRRSGLEVRYTMTEPLDSDSLLLYFVLRKS